MLMNRGLNWLWLLVACGAQAAEYDLVIENGRVMDPESGTDAVLNVAIRNGKIARVSDSPLAGDVTVNAAGLVVAPGFIDLHAHGQDTRSNHFQAADGVTTALELEIGVLPVGDWLESRRNRSPIHYGATAGHLAARIRTLAGIDVGNPIFSSDDLLRSEGLNYATPTLDDALLTSLIAHLESGLQAGGLGIGVGITYTPGASHAEIYALFELAAKYRVPVFVHIRQARYMGGDPLAPLQEVLANAAATGAALHVVHLNSSLDEDASRLALQPL